MQNISVNLNRYLVSSDSSVLQYVLEENEEHLEKLNRNRTTDLNRNYYGIDYYPLLILHLS